MLSTEQIITTMSSQGLRITDQRKTLARLFAESPGYLTPKDVYEYMGKTYSGLSFDTVYRNLRVMQELGVLEQVIFEDGVKFRAHCSEDHHHHHMICLKCQKTYPIVFCPMQLQMRLSNSRLSIINLKFSGTVRTVPNMCQPKVSSGHQHTHGKH